ncbi:MAG: YjbQ family protein [Candidatus Omnitrophica bacterium]|nr:YjbQ family protein [Candidatus Omnitrophota bacterium]
MQILTIHLPIKTKGHTDIIDITHKVQDELDKRKLNHGQVTLFVPGSTGAFTTMEYEPNLSVDIKRAFEKIAPEDADYAHHLTWGDHNGHSHVRASLLGPSITVPFENKKLTLGTWQQIVFIDFDTSSRNRNIILQIMGA